MAPLPTSATRPLPTGLKFACSVFAVVHLLIIGVYALSADSGRWPLGNINSYSPGPKFATSISVLTYPGYLQPLHMMHNYHFDSNRPNDFAVKFEVQVKNRLGEVKTFTFPDAKANFWVRHRQELLAQYLVPDQRLPPPGPRRLAPLQIKDKDKVKEAELPKIEVFKPDGERVLRLTEVSALDPVLNDPELDQPTARAKLLAQSYSRFVCIRHDGVSAELVRISRPTVMPVDLYVPRPAEMYLELKTYFGEYRRE